MKKRKKLTVLLLSAAMALSAAGGIMASKPTVAKAEEETVTTRNIVNEFMLGSWWSYYDMSIKSYAEQTADMGAAGLNFMWIPTYIADDADTKYTDYAAIEKAYADNNMMYLCDVSPSGGSGHTDAAFREMAEHCVGYFVKDEPSAAQFASTADSFRACLDNDPARSPYVNLYPSYAGTTALGGTYAQHVQNWVDTVGAENLEYLAYDHYPFTGTETVRSSYFSDMETIRKVGYNNGRLKTLGAPQSGWWAGMRKPNADEMRWNVNTFIAYGFKAITHFCWASPKPVPVADGGEAMEDFVIDYHGNRTELYEPLSYQQWQIRQLGDVLMQIDCAHAYHSGANIVDGVEKLPKSFFLQPESKQDNWIISLFNNKDNTEKWVMVMNNSTSESKHGKFTVASDSGVTSMTEYSATIDRNNLPNHKDLANTLGTPKATNISVTGGTLEADFEPGEVRIYKLCGDNLEISEGVATPEFSVPGGTYVGSRQVKINVPASSPVFYTLDGSFPHADEFGNPQGNTVKYKDPITVGQDGQWEYIPLRAVVIKNGEYSEVAEADYVITDGSKNVSIGTNVSFYNKAFTEKITVSSEKAEVAKGDVVVDGYHDCYTEVFTPGTTTGWAVVDMGKSHVIDKLSVSFWNDWEFEDVIIQVSDDFDSWTSVFNNDTDESMRSVTGEKGTDGTYKDVFGNGQTISFAPRSVRYIRCYNIGRGGGAWHGKSIWQEISAFSSFDTNIVPNMTNLLTEYTTVDKGTADGGDWNEIGGGEWTIQNGTASINGKGSSWDRALVLKEKKYKNFIIEGTFSMTDIAAGLVGFELYKTSASSVLNGNNGYVVFIENKGRVGAYDGVNGGNQEFGGTNISATNFTPDEFTFRVASIGDLISVAVNGVPAYTTRSPRADMDEGYIAIHAGSIGISVKDLWIKELSETDGADRVYFEDALYEQSEEVTAAVKLYDKLDVALGKLPTKVKVTTVGGKELSIPVTGWHSDNYDRKTAGWNDFTAEFDLSGIENTLNVMNVTAAAKVWVSAGVDREAIDSFIAVADSLDRYDYTEESWRELMQKLITAKELLDDPFAVQNSVGVASWQLKTAIDNLVNIRHDKSALKAALEKCNYEAAGYTAVSYGSYQKVLAAAQAVDESPIVSQEEINAAVAKLNNAVAALVPLCDRGALKAAVNSAKEYSGNYTEASKTRLNNAIEQAEKLYNVTGEVTKAQGDIAVSELNDAVSALKSADKDGNGGNDDDDNNGGNAGSSGCGCGGSLGGGSACTAMLALCGSAAVVSRRKRSEKRK